MSFQYCQRCGSQISEDEMKDATFCPQCGSPLHIVELVSPERTPSSRVERAKKKEAPTTTTTTFFRVILKGALLGTALSWIPVIGPFVAGYKTGSMTGRATMGLLAGFIIGMLGFLVLAVLFALLGGVVGAVFFGTRGAAVGAILSGTVSAIVLIFYGASDILLCSIGGLVGGFLKETKVESRLVDTFGSVMPHKFADTEGAGFLGNSRSRSYSEGRYNMILSIVGSRAGRFLITKLIERYF
jgi:hypothetical protein